MKDFESLLKALEGSFEASLTKLPDSIRDRVERDFPRGRHGPLWDDLSVDQRRVAAQQWDSQHDPAVEKERQSAWDLVVRKGKIEQELEKWKMVATPTATDLARQETRIAELENELFRLEQQEGSVSLAHKSKVHQARGVRKQSTRDYWENVVRPVYEDMKAIHSGDSQIARMTEKRLREKDLKTRAWDTIRKHAREHGWQ